MDSLVCVILAVVVIAVTTAVAPKLNIAGPLILVLVGIGVGLLPFVPTIEVEPEIILVGVLPPLLYSAAVALPAVEFRRDFGPIAGLSVLLVVLSSAALAVFFLAAIPGLRPPRHRHSARSSARRMPSRPRSSGVSGSRDAW